MRSKRFVDRKFLILETVVESAQAMGMWTEHLFKQIVKVMTLKDLTTLEGFLLALNSTDESNINNILKNYNIDTRSINTSKSPTTLKGKLSAAFREEITDGAIFPHVNLSASVPEKVYNIADEDFQKYLDYIIDHKEDYPLMLRFYTKGNASEGLKGGYSTNHNTIWLNMMHPDFVKKFGTLFKSNLTTSHVPGSLLTSSILYKLLESTELISTFIHELQHAYDDWRSSGRIIARDDEHKEIREKGKTAGASRAEKVAGRNIELDHVSEVWARMQQGIQLLLNPSKVPDGLIVEIYYGHPKIKALWASVFLNNVHALFLNTVGPYDRKVDEDLKKRTYKVFSQVLNKRISQIQSSVKAKAPGSEDLEKLIKGTKEKNKGAGTEPFSSVGLKNQLKTHWDMIRRLYPNITKLYV